MFGLMRKLISKPFADTPEKRDQMDKLICDMVNDSTPTFRSNKSENKKFSDNLAAIGRTPNPMTIKGTIDYGDWPPTEKPVWRPHNGRDLPTDAVEVAFSNGETCKVENGVYFIPSKRGWMRYRGGKYVGSVMCNVVAYHTGEYVRRVECKECWGGGKEIQTRTSRFSDHGWVMTNTTYTGAKCPYCKGKGYTLERFKR